MWLPWHCVQLGYQTGVTLDEALKCLLSSGLLPFHYMWTRILKCCCLTGGTVPSLTTLSLVRLVKSYSNSIPNSAFSPSIFLTEKKYLVGRLNHLVSFLPQRAQVSLQSKRCQVLPLSQCAGKLLYFVGTCARHKLCLRVQPTQFSSQHGLYFQHFSSYIHPTQNCISPFHLPMPPLIFKLFFQFHILPSSDFKILQWSHPEY